MPKGYTNSIAEYLRNGGILAWGIVPTEPRTLSQETPATLARQLLGYWAVIAENTALSIKQIAEQALIAPAKCCVRSPEFNTTDKPGDGDTADIAGLTTEQHSVERAYAYLKTLSRLLRDEFGL